MQSRVGPIGSPHAAAVGQSGLQEAISGRSGPCPRLTPYSGHNLHPSLTYGDCRTLGPVSWGRSTQKNCPGLPGRTTDRAGRVPERGAYRRFAAEAGWGGGSRVNRLDGGRAFGSRYGARFTGTKAQRHRTRQRTAVVRGWWPAQGFRSPPRIGTLALRHDSDRPVRRRPDGRRRFRSARRRSPFRRQSGAGRAGCAARSAAAPPRARATACLRSPKPIPPVTSSASPR